MQSVCFHYMGYGKKKQHKLNTPTTPTSNRVLFLTFCSIMSYCPGNVYFQITITRKFKALNKINKQTNVDDSVDSSFEAPIRLYIWAAWYIFCFKYYLCFLRVLKLIRSRVKFSISNYLSNRKCWSLPTNQKCFWNWNVICMKSLFQTKDGGKKMTRKRRHNGMRKYGGNCW